MMRPLTLLAFTAASWLALAVVVALVVAAGEMVLVVMGLRG